jgi:hypothetical protein
MESFCFVPLRNIKRRTHAGIALEQWVIRVKLMRLRMTTGRNWYVRFVRFGHGFYILRRHHLLVEFDDTGFHEDGTDPIRIDTRGRV